MKALSEKDLKKAVELQKKINGIQTMMDTIAIDPSKEQGILSILGISGLPDIFDGQDQNGQILLGCSIPQEVEALLDNEFIKNLGNAIVLAKKVIFPSQKITKPDILLHLISNSESKKLSGFSEMLGRIVSTEPIDGFLTVKNYVKLTDSESVVLLRKVQAKILGLISEEDVPGFYLDKFLYKNEQFSNEKGNLGIPNLAAIKNRVESIYQEKIYAAATKGMDLNQTEKYQIPDIKKKELADLIITDICSKLNPSHYKIIKNSVMEF